MANKAVDLLNRADEFLTKGSGSAKPLVKELVALLREYHPIVNPPLPVVENPNVVSRRPLVTAGLLSAIAELQTTFGEHIKVVGTTNIRRSVMKDGGVKAKLGIKFKASTYYNKNVDPIKVISRHINDVMDQNGLAHVSVVTTSGSQMSFSARVFVEGDEDYDRWLRISRI